MKKSTIGLAMALIALLPVAAFAAGGGRTKAAPVTAGDFAVMLAKATGATPAQDASAAAVRLADLGVPIGDYRQPLTERKLTEILDFYGISAKTAAPDSTVSAAKAQTALVLLSSSLASGAMRASATRPAPDTLDDCLTLSNHGQCVVCCKELGGSANTCAKQCFAINKPSPEEPIP